MDRRNFLKRAGALSLPLLGGAAGVKAAGSSMLTALLPPDSDKVLVLVQLTGGNDGLNTLIPLDQLSALQSVRTNVYLPESSLRPITTSLALHGRMQGMQNLFNDGLLSIVQNVGYPNQNRSHFRSTDIWTTASDATTELSTGWIGRHLEVDVPGFPEGYPNSDHPHPPAISMGSVANATCQGTVTNLSQTVNNPFNLTYLAPGGNTPLPNDNYGDELGFLRIAIEQTNAYGAVIQDAANAGDTQATYPGYGLGNQLQNVARLISGGLETKVYVVSMGGFDTHATQVNSGSTTTGWHADLLDELSASIAAFQQDLELLGLADRVLGMTFSEFGRRIRSNNSRGTDHGTAAPMFLFGNCASGTILGNNPTIDTSVDQNAGVPMEYDFRDIYGSVLVDWFDVSESDVRGLLYPGFVYLPVANGCSSALPVNLLNFTAVGLDKAIELEWQTSRESDNAGFTVQRSLDGRNFGDIGWVPAAGGSEGVRSYTLTDRDVRTGPVYYYRLKQQDVSGGFEYSPIRTARLAGAELGVWSFGHPYPNPVETETTVQVYAPSDGRVNYNLYDAAGARVLSDSRTVYGRTDNQLTIRVGRLPAGVYTLRLDAGDGNYQNRKMVVR